MKQFCHTKISITPALFCVCLGTGTVPASGSSVVARWWSPVLPLSPVSAVWLQELRTLLLLGLPELQRCCSPLWKHSAEGVQAVPWKTNWVRWECFFIQRQFAAFFLQFTFRVVLQISAGELCLPYVQGCCLYPRISGHFWTCCYMSCAVLK